MFERRVLFLIFNELIYSPNAIEILGRNKKCALTSAFWANVISFMAQQPFITYKAKVRVASNSFDIKKQQSVN